MSHAGLDPDAPLKIAYLTYGGKPHVGGQGVYTRHLTKALADLGHSVEVFGGQPYPILDDRVTLTKLPSLDTFNDYFPGRFPGFWELKTREDLLEMAAFMTGVFPEPLHHDEVMETARQVKGQFIGLLEGIIGRL